MDRLWFVRNGNKVAIVTATNREAAKGAAFFALTGDKDNFIVEPLTSGTEVEVHFLVSLV